MSDIKPEWVEAATVALVSHRREMHGLSPIDRLPWAGTSDMERAHVWVALAAVVPAIREELARAIEAAQFEVECTHHFGYGASGWSCRCGFTSPVNRQRTEHIMNELNAAAIVRGDRHG